jgi:hypothetical protein
MADFSGSALDVKWQYGTGTYTLTGDQRTFSYTPSIDLIETTAGADANKNYISGPKDGQAQFEALMQTGTALTGTAMYSTLNEGNAGTLVWSPEGTATTKPKYTMPAISLGVSYGYPYSDAVTTSVSFQQNGARTEGTN